jgi:uncharacterized membrane protein
MIPTTIHALEIAAIVVAGTMTGNEIAVAVFFLPRISRLEDAMHVGAAQTLARALGTVMPLWYALTFLLSLAATFAVHTMWSTPWWLALASTALFAIIIVYTVFLPVPINNQIARWKADSLPANWRELRRRWDMLHTIRVGFLVVALILLVTSSVI